MFKFVRTKIRIKQLNVLSNQYNFSQINQKVKSVENNKVARTKAGWYNEAAQYWASSGATIKSVTGGFPELNEPDVRCSKKFLSSLILSKDLVPSNVIDCGGGIGRVSKQVLCPIFKEVDIVDQNFKYIEEAKQFLSEDANMKDFYVEGLQKFNFKKVYSCIWIQWVASHLTNEDLLQFLQRCSKSISNEGVIIVKENIADSGFKVHEEDFSFSRSDAIFTGIFEKTGLKIVRKSLQEDFPKDMLDVCIYALKNTSNNHF